MTKPQWMEKVEITATYHKTQLRDNPKHRLADTAKALNKSIGRTSEELQLANALKDTEMRKKLERFKFVEDALGFLKDKRKEMRLV